MFEKGLPVKLEHKGGGKDMAIGDPLELFLTVNKIEGWISRRIVLLGYSPRVLKVQAWSFSALHISISRSSPGSRGWVAATPISYVQLQQAAVQRFVVLSVNCEYL